MVRTPSGPPPRGLFQYRYKIEDGKLFIKAGEMPTTGSPTAGMRRSEGRHAPDRKSRRMARPSPASLARQSAKRPRTASPVETRKLVLCFRQRRADGFLLQIVTGILLALVYVPSAGEAWNSLQALNHDIALGWFIRALHGWGSNFMVAIVLVHMMQVFLFGAYKYPRELTWILGVFLLLVTLGMAFTGQVMRFDQDAYWGLGIGASIVSRVPLLGPWLVKLMLGGPIIAGATLSRFFALHVFVIPGTADRASSACTCCWC